MNEEKLDRSGSQPGKEPQEFEKYPALAAIIEKVAFGGISPTGWNKLLSEINTALKAENSLNEQVTPAEVMCILFEGAGPSYSWDDCIKAIELYKSYNLRPQPSQPVQGKEWNPMSSAPKDGTEIIMAYDKDGKDCQHVSWSKDAVCAGDRHYANTWATTGTDCPAGSNLPCDEGVMWKYPTEPPATEEQAIEVLNRQIQERDNRIKELEKERDELACDFVHWVRSGEYGYHPGKKNWKLPDMSPTYTTQQLLTEYKKTQTK